MKTECESLKPECESLILLTDDRLKTICLSQIISDFIEGTIELRYKKNTAKYFLWKIGKTGCTATKLLYTFTFALRKL